MSTVGKILIKQMATLMVNKLANKWNSYKQLSKILEENYKRKDKIKG